MQRKVVRIVLDRNLAKITVNCQEPGSHPTGEIIGRCHIHPRKICILTASSVVTQAINSSFTDTIGAGAQVGNSFIVAVAVGMVTFLLQADIKITSTPRLSTHFVFIYAKPPTFFTKHLAVFGYLAGNGKIPLSAVRSSSTE